MQVPFRTRYTSRVTDRARRRRPRRSGCPIGFALDILGDRWTLLIVRDMMFGGKRTFGQFLASEEGIATNILAERLKRLEASGVLRRVDDAAPARPRASYELTEMGIGLVPVLLDLVVWGARHDPGTAAPASFVKRAMRERERLLAEITSGLRKGRTGRGPVGQARAPGEAGSGRRLRR